MNQSERRQYLIRRLCGEDRSYRDIAIPESAGEQRLLLRGLMNIRPPMEADAQFLAVQDAYLAGERSRRGVTDAADLVPVRGGICLWQGDITTLRCDAIVNAANSGMTGCYIPNHRCIDNCIHTYAGVQLRLECARMMEEQGHEEPTGRAKITTAWNLPCRYVLHTVGPIVSGTLTPEHERMLASCYRSCLELAAEHRLESIAFCCISTGEFHFPNDRAAQIAVKTVDQFMERGSGINRVIFNVYRDEDREIYEKLLGAG